MSENNNDRKMGYIRWYPNRGLPKITAEVFSPFTYRKVILDRLKWMSPTEQIEFLDQGQKVVMTTTVKAAREMLGHVVSVLDNLDLSKLDRNDRNLIQYAAPWEFWKSKKIQDIIKKYL